MKAILANNQKTCQTLLRKLSAAKVIGFDTESSGPPLLKKKMLNVYCSRLVGFSIAFADHSAYYVPVAHYRGNVHYAQWYPIICAVSRVPQVWVHNWKHDSFVLRNSSLPVPPCSAMRDSMVACWLASLQGQKGYGLKDLSLTHLGVNAPSFEDVVGKKGQFSSVDPQAGLAYASLDALSCMRLGRMAYDKLDDIERKRFTLLDMPMVGVLGHIEESGIAIDSLGLTSLFADLQHRLDKCQVKWTALIGDVCMNSPKQLREALYDTGIWSTDGVPLTPKGLPSTNKEAMEIHVARETGIGRKLAKNRQEYQELSKIVSTYTMGLVEMAGQYPDGRLHPSFHQTGTRTGRLSCSGPNLQQIPSHSELGLRVKRCFVPSEGHVFVSADYSQIELRVLAHYCPGGMFERAYKEGKDIHQQTADFVGCSRTVAKTLNFATIYGAGPKKLAAKMGVKYRDARQFLKSMNEAYPEIEEYKQRMVDAADRDGYVRTLLGRRRYLPEMQAEGPMRWKGERLATNTPIQGTAADIMNRAMVNLYARLLGRDGIIVGQVHDELLVEVPEHAAEDVGRELKEILENAVELNVPLVADPVVCRNWAESK